MSLSFRNPSPLEALKDLKIDGIDVEDYLNNLSPKYSK